jgi:D-3-phosphoglycerate dehydrogenase
MSTVDALIIDLLEWIGPGPRSYAEVQEVWRTSCPRLPVWEDAVDAAYIQSRFVPGEGRVVEVSPTGVAHLRNAGRGLSFSQRS